MRNKFIKELLSTRNLRRSATSENKEVQVPSPRNFGNIETKTPKSNEIEIHTSKSSESQQITDPSRIPFEKQSAENGFDNAMSLAERDSLASSTPKTTVKKVIKKVVKKVVKSPENGMSQGDFQQKSEPELATSARKDDGEVQSNKKVVKKTVKKVIKKTTPRSEASLEEKSNADTKSNEITPKTMPASKSNNGKGTKLDASSFEKAENPSSTLPKESITKSKVAASVTKAAKMKDHADEKNSTPSNQNSKIHSLVSPEDKTRVTSSQTGPRKISSEKKLTPPASENDLLTQLTDRKEKVNANMQKNSKESPLSKVEKSADKDTNFQKQLTVKKRADNALFDEPPQQDVSDISDALKVLNVKTSKNDEQIEKLEEMVQILTREKESLQNVKKLIFLINLWTNLNYP